MLTELPCPNCGSELAFLDQYQRHYCHACQRYAPEGYGARGRQKCPTCGGVLSYVAQYDRFYCYRCNAYAAIQLTPPAAPAPVAPVEPAARAQPPAETKPAEPIVVPAAVPEKKAEEPAEAPPAVPAQAPAEPAPAATAEPGPEPAAEPAAKETTPTQMPVSTPEPAATELAAKEAEKPSMAMRILASSKPAVVRLKVFSLRKPELVDLCRAYDLDPSGNKEQLQDRLLGYLDRLEVGAQPEAEHAAPAAVVVPETPPEEAPRPSMEAVEPLLAEKPAPAPEQHAEIPTFAAAEPPTQAVVLEQPPARASAPAAMPIVVVPEVVEAPRVEHPCPTCGRELQYVSQYGRWYCYSCQRYAPAERARFACPNCGATLRWIDPYERWWCDACRRYASADLPKPSRAAAVAVQPVVKEVATPAAQAAVSQTALSGHRHASPNGAVGLIVFGILLFLVETILVEFPAVFPVDFGVTLAPEYALVIRFFAFLFVALGAVAGLIASRERA